MTRLDFYFLLRALPACPEPARLGWRSRRAQGCRSVFLILGAIGRKISNRQTLAYEKLEVGVSATKQTTEAISNRQS
jgi:hypothetical protein